MRRIPALVAVAATVALIAADCAGSPATKAGQTQSTSATGQTTAGTSTPAAAAQSPASATSPEVTKVAPAAASPQFQAGFSGADGKAIANGAEVSLPTGAPPEGRIYPGSNESGATVYVTIDGTVPTDKNFWQAFKPGTGPDYISSMDAKTRLYRAVAYKADQTSRVATLVVTWFDQQNPTLVAPGFAVPKTDSPDGPRQDVAAGGRISLPLNGDTTAEGRLYITCNYAGATIYITRDGSDPGPKNSWQSGICDGTYIYSLDPGETTYKVMATLRGSQSPVATLNVTWKAE